MTQEMFLSLFVEVSLITLLNLWEIVVGTVNELLLQTNALTLCSNDLSPPK